MVGLIGAGAALLIAVPVIFISHCLWTQRKEKEKKIIETRRKRRIRSQKQFEKTTEKRIRQQIENELKKMAIIEEKIADEEKPEPKAVSPYQWPYSQDSIKKNNDPYKAISPRT